MHGTTEFCLPPEVERAFSREKKQSSQTATRSLSNFVLVVCNGGSIMSPSTISHYVCRGCFFSTLVFSSLKFLRSVKRATKAEENAPLSWNKRSYLSGNECSYVSKCVVIVDQRVSIENGILINMVQQLI